MEAQKERSDPCNRDCFHCIFPDCITDTVTSEEIAFAREMDLVAISQRQTPIQKRRAEAQRRFRSGHREHVRKKQRTRNKAYYSEKRDKILDRMGRYYAENREEINRRRRERAKEKRAAAKQKTDCNGAVASQ